MIQRFDTDIACRLGVTEAVVFELIKEGLVKNRTRLFGDIWTFLPYAKLVVLMPYTSRATIAKAVKHLECEKLILKHTRFVPLGAGGCEGNYFRLTQEGIQLALESKEE